MSTNPNKKQGFVINLWLRSIRCYYHWIIKSAYQNIEMKCDENGFLHGNQSQQDFASFFLLWRDVSAIEHGIGPYVSLPTLHPVVSPIRRQLFGS